MTTLVESRVDLLMTITLLLKYISILSMVVIMLEGLLDKPYQEEFSKIFKHSLAVVFVKPFKVITMLEEFLVIFKIAQLQIYNRLFQFEVPDQSQLVG